MINDEGLEHSFLTQDCKIAFEESVVEACENSLRGEISSFSWYEEWEITRIEDVDDENPPDGVWIIATTDAISVQDSTDQCVNAALGKALEKFKRKRWADLQIIVLEASKLVPASLAASSVQNFEATEKELIDHFFLIEDEMIFESSELELSAIREREVREQHEYQHVIDSPISEERVQRFKEDYLKGRQDIGATEKIFRYFDAYQMKNEQHDSAYFGFNRLVPKGSFVDDSNWADLRGWEFAVAEERWLLNNLYIKMAESISKTGQTLPGSIAKHPDEILGTIEKISEIMKGHGYCGNLIVVATDLNTETIISLEKLITIPSWELSDDLKTNWILGKHEDFPILYIKNKDLKTLFVVDVRRFASLLQYEPLVDLNVSLIGKETLNQILENNKDRTLDMGTLHSKVHLTLYQSYQIQIHEQYAIWATKFKS